MHRRPFVIHPRMLRAASLPTAVRIRLTARSFELEDGTSNLLQTLALLTLLTWSAWTRDGKSSATRALHGHGPCIHPSGSFMPFSRR